MVEAASCKCDESRLEVIRKGKGLPSGLKKGAAVHLPWEVKIKRTILTGELLCRESNKIILKVEE